MTVDPEALKHIPDNLLKWVDSFALMDAWFNSFDASTSAILKDDQTKVIFYYNSPPANYKKLFIMQAEFRGGQYKWYYSMVSEIDIDSMARESWDIFYEETAVPIDPMELNSLIEKYPSMPESRT